LMMFLVLSFLVVQAFCACNPTPADLLPLLESSETVLYGTAKSVSKVDILEVLKSSHSTTFEFVEVSLIYVNHEYPLPSKSKGLYFGSVSGFESVMNVTCAVVVPDCLLDSVRYNRWDLCPEVPQTRDTGCPTPRGHELSGDSWIDPDTHEDCTCTDGSIICQPACTCKENGIEYRIGESWWTMCQQCSCGSNAGACGTVCDDQLCTAIPLGSLASFIILVSVVIAANRARQAARDSLDTELDEMDGRQQAEAQSQIQSPDPMVLQTQGGYCQVPTHPLIMMSQQGQPVVVQVAYI